MNNPGVSELLGAVFLAVAVIHSFAIKWFQHLAQKFPDGSLLENLFHLLGEVEIVFGFWSFWLLLLLASLTGGSTVLEHLESLNFNEPLFVFVIMTMAATKPILSITQRLISWVSRWLPLGKDCSFLIATLTLGPLFGSLITEPAAMTVTAFILKDRFFDRTQSESFKYLTLAVLFVNISIGGTLTPYAAPPVLMVSSQWGWDLSFMLAHFGWRAALTVFLNSLILGALFRKELSALQASLASDDRKTPIWLIAIHVLFLSLVTLSAHHAVIFIGLFLFFLGLVSITKEHQIDL
ncbi:MAG: hypothetical protein EB078_01050, partial [Proteobacteria bacterium]|nr:hypothetical protein [Pseudomonadota bacterium]NDD03466.1 hypothetical protein [Pseudomonadota bacterium]NDG25800.1 hypothetical protein [Pseudomonadota bacterium]